MIRRLPTSNLQSNDPAQVEAGSFAFLPGDIRFYPPAT